MSSRRRKRSQDPWASSAENPWLVGLILFAVAFVVRLLFWKATPDSTWPYSSFYRGDALSWLQYAAALRHGIPFQDNLPTWPPGMGYLVRLIWDGTPAGIADLKVAWCLMGAATVGLFSIVVHRSFGFAVAMLAGLAAAFSTGLLILSTSVNNETPYLLLAMATFVLLPRPRERATIPRLAAWSMLNGLASLVRVEHALFYVLSLVVLAGTEDPHWRTSRETGKETTGRQRNARSARKALTSDWTGLRALTEFRGPAEFWKRCLLSVGLSLLFFTIPMIPWQVRIYSEVSKFNAVSRPSDAGLTPDAREAEALIKGMEWDDAALGERSKLPGFVRRLATDFVAATVRHRGGTHIRADDFQILEEAFGYVPEALSPAPFITSTGPLNFWLCNNPLATGGFSRSILDEPPPLSGGADRFHKDLLLTPPMPGTFFMDYPPHLKAYNRGYEMGWTWIRQNPGRFVSLVRTKLGNFWSGASLGFTGFGFPAGLSGIQRAVDILVPKADPIATGWRLLVLAVCILGFVTAAKRLEIYPWLLFLVSKIVVVCLFFGFARIGATALPVVFLLCSLAVVRWVLPRIPPHDWNLPRGIGRLAKIALILAAGVLLVEGVRTASRPTVLIDSERVVSADPFPGIVHRDRIVEVR